MLHSEPLRKYPRTQHIEGSKLQPGDEDLSQVAMSSLAGLPLVVEEKIDGANCALGFSESGELQLQSRGHYLTGGGRESHFNLFKQWANAKQAEFHRVLGSRYLMFGEWVYAKHTVFYDALPHYFLEFDVLDRHEDRFLCTESRAALLDGLPVASVPVLARRRFDALDELTSLIAAPAWQTPAWQSRLSVHCDGLGLDPVRAARETDASGLMEGLYVKWEEDGEVKGRYKWVRAGFLQAVAESGGHWQSRPIVPNLLAPGASLFA